jgi:hypothetical protein
MKKRRRAAGGRSSKHCPQRYSTGVVARCSPQDARRYAGLLFPDRMARHPATYLQVRLRM